MGWPRTRRLLVPLAVSCTASATAVAVNLATEWKHSLLAWISVAALTGISGWLALRHPSAQSVPPQNVTTVVTSRILTRRSWTGKGEELKQSSAIGVHAEVELLPDGTVRYRAFTEQSARALFEQGPFEVTRELERD